MYEKNIIEEKNRLIINLFFILILILYL